MTYNQGEYPGQYQPGGPVPGSHGPSHQPYGQPPPYGRPQQSYGGSQPPYGQQPPAYGQPYGGQSFGGPQPYGGQQLPVGSPYPGGSGQPGPLGPAAPSGRGGVGMVLQFVVAGAGLLAVVGAFLPWVSVSASFGGASFNETVSGIDGSDGWISLVLGLIAAVAAVAAAVLPVRGTPLRLISGIVAVVAGLIVAGVGGYDLTNAASLASKSSSLVHTSTGVGLYLTVVAGVVLLGAGIGAIVVSRQKW